MHSISRRQWLAQSACGAGLGLAALAVPAWAQPRVAQTRIVCGFPSSPIDVLARQYADRLRGTYADALYVDSKPGAGGRLAIEALKGAPADGSALLFTPSSMVVMYPHLYRALNYDALQDIVPVTPVTDVAFALCVGPMVPAQVQTLAQFLAWCQANPKLANYAVSAVGSGPHLAAATLSHLSKVPLTMVGYRTTGMAVTELLGGQIAAMASTHPVLVEHVKSGRVRMLAVSSPARLPQLPQVPTFVECGFPQLSLTEWFGIFLPRGASPELLERTNAAVRAASALPEVMAALEGMTLQPFTMGAADFRQRVRAEHDQWAKLLRQLDFQLLD